MIPLGIRHSVRDFSMSHPPKTNVHSQFHYYFSKEKAQFIWDDYEPDEIFFETYWDTSNLDLLKKKHFLICRIPEIKCTNGNHPVEKWILKEICESSESEEFYYRESFGNDKEILLKNFTMEINHVEPICTFRVDRFYGKCSKLKNCSRKGDVCVWVDISVRHHKEIHKESGCHAEITSVHPLPEIKKQISPSKFIVCLSKEFDKQMIENIPHAVKKHLGNDF